MLLPHRPASVTEDCGCLGNWGNVSVSLLPEESLRICSSEIQLFSSRNDTNYYNPSSAECETVSLELEFCKREAMLFCIYIYLFNTFHNAHCFQSSFTESHDVNIFNSHIWQTETGK